MLENEGREARHRLVPGRRDRDAECCHFAFGGIRPGRIDTARGAAVLEHAIPVAQRPFERRDARAVLAVDRQNDAIEKAAPFRRASGEEAIHGGREPHHPEMVGEALGRGDGRAIDAAFSARRTKAVAGVEARAELHLRQDFAAVLEFQRNGPAAGAALARAIGKLRAAQAAAWREERQGFEQVRLAGSVMPGQHHGGTGQREVERRVGAEIAQNETPDARSTLRLHGATTRTSLLPNARSPFGSHAAQNVLHGGQDVGHEDIDPGRVRVQAVGEMQVRLAR